MDISESTRRVLRGADRRLRAIRRGDRPSVYRICRITMASLAPVDAFYIALIRSDEMTVFPYTFDRGEYIEPDVLPYRAGGITHWILASRRTYRWADDDGALLNRGVPFGAEADVSRDALVTPLIDPATGSAIGLMSVQSYSPAVFTKEHQVAFEWLSQAAMLTINRDEEDRDHASLVYPELDTTAIAGLTDLADHIWHRLGTLQAAIERLASHQGIAADPELRSMTASLGALCEDLQIETAAAMASDGVPEDSGLPLPALTPREREIVQLIADDRTNQEIAAELHLSEKTVKTHVTNILRKFNATQRSAVAWQVRTRSGGHRT